MKRRVWLIIAVLLALFSGPACALGGLLDQLGLPIAQEPSGRNVIEGPVRPLPTLYPTVTPRPGAHLPAQPAAPDRPTPAAPADDRSFRLELTEAELAAFVGEGGFAQQGLRIQNMTVVITEQNVIATFNADHADSGLSGEITMVGLPQVVNGKLYLQIVDYSLGAGFSGFARLIANALITAAIDSLNTASGIPIPIGGVAEVTSIELLPGALVVNGRLP